MKKISKIGLAILFSLTLILTGCNTVKGAFQGAGQDAQAVSRELHLDDNQSHTSTHHYYQKTPVTTSAATTVTPEQVDHALTNASTTPATSAATTTTTVPAATVPSRPSLSPSGD